MLQNSLLKKVKSYYPKHPDNIIIKSNEFYPDSLTEDDIWSWYDDIKSKIYPYLDNQTVILTMVIDGKPIYKRNIKPGELIVIRNKDDYDKWNNGRVVEFHPVFRNTTTFYFVDIDPGKQVDFSYTKRVTEKVYQQINMQREVSKTHIRFSGNKGFYVIGTLRSPMTVDSARNTLKDILSYLVETDPRLTLSIAKDNQIRLDVTTLKTMGSLRAPYSLHNLTGLASIPVNNITSFKKDEARIDKIISHSTGLLQVEKGRLIQVLEGYLQQGFAGDINQLERVKRNTITPEIQNIINKVIGYIKELGPTDCLEMIGKLLGSISDVEIYREGRFQDPNSTNNQIRHRLIDPTKFNQIWTKDKWNELKEPGISYIVGLLKEDVQRKKKGELAVQAIRFEKDEWAEQKAEAWFNKVKNNFVIDWRDSDWNKIKKVSYISKEPSPSGLAPIYRYSPSDIKRREKKKKKKYEHLVKRIEDIRNNYREDIQNPEGDNFQPALATALIDHTYERVGNPRSPNIHETFGVSTWRKKHISFPSENQMIIEYKGKKGVNQYKTVSDPEIIRSVRILLKDKDDDDELFEDIDHNDINRYLSKFNITAKDLRGFHANDLMEKAMNEGYDFKEALKLVAEKLGHEVNTLKNSYLNPDLVERYEGKKKK